MLKLGSNVGLFAFEADEWPWIQYWSYAPAYRDFFRDQIAMKVDTMRGYSDFQNGNAFLVKTTKVLELDGQTYPIGTIVGLVMLYDMHIVPRNVKLAVLIDEKFQGNSFCQESIWIVCDYVFNRLGYHKVIFEMMEENTDLASLIEFGGFYKEAVFKDEAFIDGQFKNVVRYCIIKEEALKKLKEFEEVFNARTISSRSRSSSRRG